MQRVLILDDSEFIRRTYFLSLREGYRCDLAPDGVTGLALFRQALDQDDPYHFVLTDLTMPLGGIRTIQAMRTMERGRPDCRPVRILVVSSCADDPSLESELQGCEVSACLLKPVMPSELRSVLKLFN